MVIEEISIAYTDCLLDTWLKTKTLDGLNSADSNFIDLSTNNVDCGIISAKFSIIAGHVVLD